MPKEGGPSFFLYDNDKDLKACLVAHVVACHILGAPGEKQKQKTLILSHPNGHMTRVTRKRTLRFLLSYHGHVTRAHPSFGMTPSFQNLTADIINHILEKSVSCQKKDGCGHARPSFFSYDNDKDLKVCFLMTRIIYGHLAYAGIN